MKRLKIKWINVIKLTLFIFCISMILHDMCMLTVYSWFTGKACSFSWFGLITFILFCIIAELIYNDFEEQTKSTQSSTDQSFRKGI